MSLDIEIDNLDTTLQAASTGQQIEIVAHPDGVRIAILDHTDAPEAIFTASGESALMLAGWLIDRAMSSPATTQQLHHYVEVTYKLGRLSDALFGVNRP